ncbi:MAG: CoA transferase [Chloroflexota bacterium]|nr:CoA transferase [Chloroflexota bacterium]
MPGPLDGIRILEFTQIIAAPFGGMLLSDMGAEVIKIEPIEGEPWRLHNQFLPQESRAYISLNRGKKSLPLNLKDPEATAIVHRLIKEIDVVIINARPDVPEKLGTDYETLSKINPNLIYCDNTAFGRNGPDSYRPGYDIVVQAVSGLLAADNKVENGVPQQVSATAVADYSTGIAIAWSVCAALFARERSGKGQKIDTTLLSTALSVQGSFMELDSYTKETRLEFLDTLNVLKQAEMPYEVMLEQQRALAGPTTAFRIYYTTYKTLNGIIAIGCLSEHLRKKAAAVMGIQDPRFEPNYDPEDPSTIEQIENLHESSKLIIASLPTEEWLKKFDEAGVPAGPVRFVQELLDDEQVIANEMVVELEHSKAGIVRMAGPMVRMSETPLQPQFASPALGEHSEEILAFLGYTEKAISGFKERGITV